jgi:hypothetical protein
MAGWIPMLQMATIEPIALIGFWICVKKALKPSASYQKDRRRSSAWSQEDEQAAIDEQMIKS